MRKITVILLIFFTCLFGLAILQGCDTLKEDVAPVETANTEISRVEVGRPGETLLVDLLQDRNIGSAGSISISRYPSRGILEFITPVMVAYYPNETFTSGGDYFIYQYLEGGEVVDTDTVGISMDGGTDSLSCTLIASPDVYTMCKSDTLYVDSLEMSPVYNDWFCGNPLPELGMYSAGQGTIFFEGTTFTYSPPAEYVGEDTIVYFIAKEGQVAYGMMTILVEDCGQVQPCQVVAADDDIQLEYFDPNVTWTLDVLANDSIECNGVSVSIIDPPYYGSATEDDSSAFGYILYNSGNASGQVDTLRYAVMGDNNTDTATVFIRY